MLGWLFVESRGGAQQIVSRCKQQTTSSKQQNSKTLYRASARENVLGSDAMVTRYTSARWRCALGNIISSCDKVKDVDVVMCSGDSIQFVLQYDVLRGVVGEQERDLCCVGCGLDDLVD